MTQLGWPEFYAHLRKACTEAGGQRPFAQNHGFSDSYISDVLNARRDPSDKLCRALNLRRRVIFEPIPAVQAMVSQVTPAEGTPGS